jgi:hypothetical protein
MACGSAAHQPGCVSRRQPCSALAHPAHRPGRRRSGGRRGRGVDARSRRAGGTHERDQSPERCGPHSTAPSRVDRPVRPNAGATFARPAPHGAPGPPQLAQYGPPDPSNARISEVLLVITVVMVVLAAANTIFITWATAMESRRFSGVVRSLGATPEQTVGGLAAARHCTEAAAQLASSSSAAVRPASAVRRRKPAMSSSSSS